MFRKIFFSLFLISFAISNAQDDDLLKMLDSMSTEKKPREYTYATFKTTRLVNQHTAEVLGKKSLDFRIMHRFGDINSGAYNAWGIDGAANIRLSLEYCVDGRFMFGIGRSSFEKLTDGFVKWKFLRQTRDNKIPFTATVFGGAYYTNQKSPVDNNGLTKKYNNVSERMSYVSELMIMRKFGSAFSMQLSGAYVHTNMVDSIKDPNDQFAAGGLFRIKLTKRQALTIEYFYVINKMQSIQTYDSFGIGYEIETGGHVFQIHLTNSFGIAENQFISYTRSSWQNAGVRIGFNISRVFTLAH